ncbi:MAG: tRNA pseudouridine(38-40) synthase TruA [Planctomycetota bacterium]|nr:tRNA pseudouridine(38-40) synthase TruA [Planctomycetota bacterium]
MASPTRPSDMSVTAARNIKLTLAYDGTNYVGWQIQPNGLSVQQVLQTAIKKLTGEDISVTAAGRTDSGVHAVGQVANFHTRSTIPVERFRPGLQTFLPDAVVVLKAERVPDEFHATYSALQKRYRYVIVNGDSALPFLNRFAYHSRGPLDADAMHAAAQELLGTHDFRCFESHYPNKATSIRTIKELRIRRLGGWSVWDVNADAPSPAGSYICLDIVADGFLYNMVRAIVGTLLKVGRGRWTKNDIRRILQGLDRSQAGETAPPHGLYLVAVDY